MTKLRILKKTLIRQDDFGGKDECVYYVLQYQERGDEYDVEWVDVPIVVEEVEEK